MNLAKRAKLLQAHNLRCQGKTYRQMGAEMNCAPSTAARYLREFERHREEIIQQLAQDQLIGLLQQLPETADDLHQRHVNAAREFRLLLNALDQIEDRRQKRVRRVYENNVQDAKEHFQGLEQIVENMFKSGYWEPTEDLEEIGAPVFGPPDSKNGTPKTSPSGGGAPNGRQGHGPTAKHRATTRANPKHEAPKTKQNRTKQNKTEQNRNEKPPVQAPPRPKRDKPKPPTQQQPPQPQFPAPTRTGRFADIPNPPIDVSSLRPMNPNDPRARWLFGNR